jgi:cytochrome c oxidase subunit 3
MHFYEDRPLDDHSLAYLDREDVHHIILDNKVYNYDRIFASNIEYLVPFSKNFFVDTFSFPAFTHLVLLFMSCMILVFYICSWVDEVNVESDIFCRYTLKVKSALICSFYIFILSEFMVFFGFFWGMYELIGMGQELTGNIQLNFNQTDYLLLYADPMLGSFTLFLSGYFANYSLIALSSLRTKQSIFFLGISILLGIYFMLLQIQEYYALSDTCSRKTSFSIFYIITGLHGFHIFVGLSYLSYVLHNLLNKNIYQQKILAFSLCLAYWHFVDYIWCFAVYKLYGYFAFPLLLF